MSSDDDCVCIFGYGSLVWKPEPAFKDCPFFYAKLDGYCRRFWQGSPDHRGTVEEPGRVVTLLPRETVQRLSPAGEPVEAETYGAVYVIPAPVAKAMFPDLDVREAAGYEKLMLRCICDDGQERECIVYTASSSNEHFLGPCASVEDTARHIFLRTAHLAAT